MQHDPADIAFVRNIVREYFQDHRETDGLCGGGGRVAICGPSLGGYDRNAAGVQNCLGFGLREHFPPLCQGLLQQRANFRGVGSVDGAQGRGCFQQFGLVGTVAHQH